MSLVIDVPVPGRFITAVPFTSHSETPHKLRRFITETMAHWSLIPVPHQQPPVRTDELFWIRGKQGDPIRAVGEWESP